MRVLHHYAESVDAIDRAIMLDATDRRLFEARAVVLSDMGQHAASFDAFSRAIEAGPETVADYYHRG